jgi:hypothetical protein
MKSFFDLPRFEEDAKSYGIDAGVVGDNCQILHASVANCFDELFRNAT